MYSTQRSSCMKRAQDDLFTHKYSRRENSLSLVDGIGSQYSSTKYCGAPRLGSPCSTPPFFSMYGSIDENIENSEVTIAGLSRRIILLDSSGNESSFLKSLIDALKMHHLRLCWRISRGHVSFVLFFVPGTY
jgi:hypothetical protein